MGWEVEEEEKSLSFSFSCSWVHFWAAVVGNPNRWPTRFDPVSLESMEKKCVKFSYFKNISLSLFTGKSEFVGP